MKAIERFIRIARGERVPHPAPDPDDFSIFPGISDDNTYFILAELRRRRHDDLENATVKADVLKVRMITTNSPAIEAQDKPESPNPEVKPDRLTLRERWRQLKRELDEIEQNKT